MIVCMHNIGTVVGLFKLTLMTYRPSLDLLQREMEHKKEIKQSMESFLIIHVILTGMTWWT
jgi:hypothetical protein